MAITSKQLGGFRMANRDWISENDAYNKRVYGITKAEYCRIHRAIVDLTGNSHDVPSLAAINKRLSR